MKNENPPPAYKQGVNNELISTREKIKQAKVRAIRAVVKKVKKTEENIENESDILKLSSQVKRFVDQLEYLKHQNLLKLGVAMLSARKTPDQYLSNPESTTEEMCVACMLKCKGMTERMAAIKEKFNLNDSIEWRDVIKNLGLKNKKKKKTQKQKDKNAERQKDKTGKNNVEKDPVSKKPAATKIVNRKDPTEDGETSDMQVAVEKPIKKNSKVKTVTKETTVDPFFITEDGANYVAVVSRNQEESTNDDDDKKVRPGRQFSKVPQSKQNNKQTFNKPIKPIRLGTNNPNDDDPNVHPSWSAKRKQKALPSFQGKKVKFDNDNANSSTNTKTEDMSNLHPSWAAKQKLKPTITEFKGSKITFDED